MKILTVAFMLLFTLCMAWHLIWWFASLEKYGHTWHQMFLLRPGVIKQHKHKPIGDFGDHGPPLITILCLSSRSSIINIPIQSLMLRNQVFLIPSCRRLCPPAISVGIHYLSPLRIWPKYLHFLSFIIFMSSGLTFKPAKLFSLLICCL